MKKSFFLLILLLAATGAWSQSEFSLKQDEPAVVYSLPKTEFVIEVKTEKRTETPGQFYKYSERYLATSKVILQENFSYKVVSIDVKTRAIADSQRTYAFVMDKNTPVLRLSVNNHGILCGVNVKCLPTMELPVKSRISTVENSIQNSLLPLGEEYMLAGSEAKLAEGAAKQIYRIRESRLGLLTADVEKLPADGSSLKKMLDGLSKMEQELTELFIGKTSVTTETKTLFLVPEKAMNNQVLFRVSVSRGIVEADDLSGTPYYVNVTPTIIPTTAVTIDPKSKPTRVLLNSVLPASTKFSISDGINTLFSKQYFVPQFGRLIPVPLDILYQSNVKVLFDNQTGRILNVE